MSNRKDNGKSTLRTRFESFVKTLDEFEDIDSLLNNAKEPDDRMRADYLFQSRQIIVEQKTLVSDPVGRPQRFAEKIMRDRGIIAFGTVSTRRIFSNQPDTDSLQRGLMLNIAKIIDDDVAKADKQVRDTRLIFGIPEATGIIVLLNEGAEMLAPDVIYYALCNAFQKKDEDGRLRYSRNDGVILISEAHTLPLPGFPRAYPINTFTSPQTKSTDKVIAFSEMLVARWATFNHVPLIKEVRQPFR
ncbi:MAG: hypothetical protein ABSE51_12910 [Terracidiphilus sp.]|jgi:hypothetical protein